MAIKYLVNMSSSNLNGIDVYSIETNAWFTSTLTKLNYIGIPSRNHKEQALLLLSLGLGKEEIEEHFNIGK